MLKKLLRNISFTLLAAITVVLVAATFVEKYYGSEAVKEYIYHSPLFIALWALLAVSGIAYLLLSTKRAATVALHISLATVLLGAFVSFLTSERGSIELHRGAVPASMFTTNTAELKKLPFRMTLVDVDTCYSNNDIETYRALIAVDDKVMCDTMEISLNSPLKKEGYSLCIKSVSGELLSLTVSHDPYGLPICYTGYLMTFFSFLALFFDRKSLWWNLLKKLGKREERKKKEYTTSKIRRSAAIVIALTILGIIRWYDTGLFPVTNGKECLLFFIWLSLLLAIIATYRKELKPIAATFFALSGIALLALPLVWESEGGSIPPILRTPLLGIHVTTIIIAYVLLGCTAINAIAALFLGYARNKKDRMEKMAHIGRVLLYPSTLLLVTGIFVGAVWANISWGRYWGWDPKEVWALITLLVCSLTFHTRSIPAMGKSSNFHIFCIVLFLSMLFTFFGVNYFFGGLHSYM